MKHILTTAAALAALVVGASPSAADLLSGRAEIFAGGAGGAGIGGAQKAEAFHDGASGFTYGALVGVEIILVDVWVQHNQHHNSNGLVGTWTQFMTGIDIGWDIGGKTKGAESVLNGKPQGGYSPGYGEFGLGFGFGVGTGQQIELPLDNSEVSDKMFVGQAHLGLGYRLSRSLSIGLHVPIQAGYAFKQGVANNLDNHYQSVQAAALLNLRFNLKIK